MDATLIWTAVTGCGTVLLGGTTVWLAASTRSLVAESKLAREEYTLSRAHWEAMSIESTRARLDAKAPKVELLLAAVKGALLPSPYGFAQPCPENQTWTFERDENERILLRCEAKLINSGGKHVSARVRTLPRGIVLPAASETAPPEPRVDQLAARIPPGSFVTFTIEADFSIKQWAEGQDNRHEQENPQPHMLAYVEVDDGDDNGITDWWSVLLTGSPVTPVHGNSAQWRIRSKDDPFVAWIDDSSRQRGRDYYITRSAKLTVSPPPAQTAHTREIETLRRLARPEIYGQQGGEN